MEKLIDKSKYLLKGGFFHILGSSFINKCIAFITNIFLVRILTKTEYGVFSGAFNVYFIVYMFSGLGITSGILYFCSKQIPDGEKKQYYSFSRLFGLITEVFLSVAILFYGLFGRVGIEETRKHIISLAFLPFAAFLFDYFTTVLRSEKENIKYSKLLNINSLFYAFFGVVGAYIGGILGTIVGRYIAYISADVLGWCYCRDYIKPRTRQKLSQDKTKDILKYSIKAGLTSVLNLILYRIDVAVIAVVVADASILASYKTGAMLPENVNFIPQCIMVYYLPLLIQHIVDIRWIKTKVREIYIFVGIICFSIAVVMYLLAPQIVMLLWGKNYLDAVPCFRILTVSFFFLSTFRTTSINILLALKRAGYTMLISIISGFSNIVLDVILISRYGSIGAAYATLIVSIIAAIMSFPYVIHIVYSGREAYE